MRVNMAGLGDCLLTDDDGYCLVDSGSGGSQDTPYPYSPPSYPISTPVTTYPTNPASASGGSNAATTALINAAGSIISRQANVAPTPVINPSTGQVLALYNPNTGQLVGGTAAGSVAGLGITSSPLLLLGGLAAALFLSGRK